MLLPLTSQGLATLVCSSVFEASSRTGDFVTDHIAVLMKATGLGKKILL
jgi:hypothetical protein